MEITEIVKNFFESAQWVKEPVGLYEPIDYALQSGGKRLRPTLVLMAVKLFGGNPEKYVREAAAMEVFHNFTLLHDDVMDNADIRRGRPTVCRKWNDNTAILSGDAMLIRAYQMFSGLANSQYKKAVELFSEIAIEVCEGQQYDSDFEHRQDVTEEEYFNMVRLKTGVLLAGSLKMGAMLAGADDEDAENLYEYGINVGIAFQIWDDYLDCYGDEKTFGKKPGGDIACGKRTYLLIQALKRGGVSQQLTLKQLIDNESILPDNKFEAVMGIYEQLGMSNVCQEAMDEFYNKAIGALKKIKKSDEEKMPFVEFAKKLMGRTY